MAFLISFVGSLGWFSTIVGFSLRCPCGYNYKGVCKHHRVIDGLLIAFYGLGSLIHPTHVYTQPIGQ